MMNSTSDHRTKQNGGLNLKVDVSEIMDNNNNGEAEANQREVLVDWINSILPNLHLPIKASDEELRTCLIDGNIFCRILNRLRPSWGGHSDHPSAPRSENIKKFLAAMDELGIPRFEISDLEKGSMKTVMDCLLTLRAHSMPNVARDNYDIASSISISGSPRGDASSGGSLSPLSREDRRKVASDSKFQRNMRNPVMPEQSASLIHHVGHKFHEVFQMKQVCYAELPAAKISEMMKSNSLDNAPTQSLLSVVNGILDESVERKNGEIPHRVACLLRKVVQEIERRISTQAEHLRTQNNLFKAREEKYQSRIRVLEVLATGTSEETQTVMNQLQQIKTDKNKMEEKKKVEDEDVVRMMKEREQFSREISTLKQELSAAKKRNEQPNLQMETQAKGVQEDASERIKELECHLEDSKNKVKELSEVEEKAKELERHLVDSRNTVKELSEFEEKTKELERHLVDSRNKVKELAKFEERAKELEHHLGDSNNKVKELVQAEERVKELEHHLADSRNKVKELLEVEERAKELERHLEDSKNKVKELTETEEKGVMELDRHLTDYRNKVKELALVEDRVKEVEHHLTDKMKELSKVEERVKELEHHLTDKVKELAKVEERVNKLERHLADSKNKVKEREEYYETKYESWNKKEHTYKKFIDFQFGELRKLKSCSDSIKQEILKTQKCYSEEFNGLGVKLKALADAADNFHVVLAENRRLFNEVQDLKGNIRVFCRIRPFLRGQTAKQTTIDSIGENGELSFANPTKQGKESSRLFRFNKVFGPDSTQVEVYSDTQPFVRSVLDGYNACIFAYGQTGSGKTYTMTGPNSANEEDWGVNYRALNDLFSISQNRRSSISYEISVQMMEIYNEQVRDLLSSDGSRKKLGILATSQPNGLAVPDASVNPVTSTSDIMELMDIGFKNRAVGATAMNERSSRSHSIITIHVRGTDLKTGAALRGSLHLVDLAGSERVDRSEVTGDRLREAQHINKSLSALGDVIFSLAQKNSHVPYRNSKLTQVLQTSLGGQAKTLMFVQLNPDASSYTESLSTLKFAERVSGVELGAAKSSKEGRDVRELMDQVASLKDTIGKRDEEIERLQLLKDLKNVYPHVNNEKRGTSTLRYESSTPSKNSVGATAQRSLKPSSGKGLGHTEKAASDHDNCSDHSDKRSEVDSQHSNDDLNHPNDRQSNVAGEEIGQDTPADADILGFRDADRLSDKSDGALSVGTENDGSAEHNHHPVSEVTKPSHKPEKPKSAVKAALHKFGQTASATAKETTKVSTPTSMKRSATTSTLVKPTRRWT